MWLSASITNKPFFISPYSTFRTMRIDCVLKCISHPALSHIKSWGVFRVSDTLQVHATAASIPIFLLDLPLPPTLKFLVLRGKPVRTLDRRRLLPNEQLRVDAIEAARVAAQHLGLRALRNIRSLHVPHRFPHVFRVGMVHIRGPHPDIFELPVGAKHQVLVGLEGNHALLIERFAGQTLE